MHREGSQIHYSKSSMGECTSCMHRKGSQVSYGISSMGGCSSCMHKEGSQVRLGESGMGGCASCMHREWSQVCDGKYSMGVCACACTKKGEDHHRDDGWIHVEALQVLALLAKDLQGKISFTGHALINKHAHHGAQRWLRGRQDTLRARIQTMLALSRAEAPPESFRDNFLASQAHQYSGCEGACRL